MSNADNNIEVVAESFPVPNTILTQESALVPNVVPFQESISVPSPNTAVVQNVDQINPNINRNKRFQSFGRGTGYTYEKLLGMVNNKIVKGDETRADGRMLWKDVLSNLKNAKNDKDVQVIVDSLNMDSKGVRGGTRRRKARGLRMRVSSRRSRTKRSR